ncbi:MAG: hypothetical protein N2645_01285 [Clostridia bacterium]|nr:hypothetical protein [Clostridia bacterium]
MEGDVRRFIERFEPDSKMILKGPTGSGKSTMLLERYKYMVDELGIPSEKILILLLNRSQSLEWRSKTVLKASGAVWRTSYYGFIQGEIKTYYPLIQEKCPEIQEKSVVPVFLTFESAQFLVAKSIEWRRENKNLFSSVTSYTDRIAIDLTSNLVKAATSDISYNEIGKRLYNALQLKSEEKKQIFYDCDEIISAYRKKCLELGIFDFGMAVELYNTYLFKDERYKAQLFSRVEHLVVDNIEECVPTEIDFIQSLIPNLKSCFMGYNHEGGYGEVFGSNHAYVKEKILDKCRIAELNISYSCKDYMVEFSKALFENIHDLKKNKLGKKVGIEREPPLEIRSEMLEHVAQKILTLVLDQGYMPSDITILSTYADPVTEFVIGRILEKQSIFIKNIVRKDKVLDNPFSKALITLAKLCHPSYGIFPNRDEVKSLIRLILKIDPVRSSILAGEICSQRPFARFPDIEFPGIVERVGYYNIEKYEYIRNWIREYREREKPLPINAFLQKVFLEVLISKDISEGDILEAKNLIDSAQNFIDVVSKFKNINVNKGFIDMVRGGIKSAESIFELEEKLSGDFVLLSTPLAYLAGSLNSKVVIMTSLSSRNWTPRSIKELTNVHVLTKTWNPDLIYTEEMEEENQRRYLALLIRAILKRCGDKLITYESNLSGNGFENDGILSEYFNEILSLT